MKPKSITTRVLFVKDGKVFMMLRNGKNGSSLGGSKKRWITPGGSTDEGEDGITAAIRETKEEVGITLLPRDLELLLEKYDPTYDVMMEFFICTKWKGELKVLEPEKFDRVVWQPIGEVGSLAKHDEHIGIFIPEALELLQKKYWKGFVSTESVNPPKWVRW